MTSKFQPPPTWALPVLVDEQTKKAVFNPIWLKWFVDLSANLGASGGGSLTGPGSSTNNALAVFIGTTGLSIAGLSSTGTTTQVLHGAAGGLPTWGKVENSTDTSGVDTFASFLLMGA